MSRTRTRERKRRQRLAASLREALIRARSADHKAAQAPRPTPGNGALWQLLREIERAGLRVWDVARAICCTEDERAMIAQAVAPYLAGMTPGSVIGRRKRGDYCPLEGS